MARKLTRAEAAESQPGALYRPLRQARHRRRRGHRQAVTLVRAIRLSPVNHWQQLFTRDGPRGRMNRAGSCYLWLIAISTAASGPRSLRFGSMGTCAISVPTAMPRKNVGW
jgi:hypothetical protein